VDIPLDAKHIERGRGSLMDSAVGCATGRVPRVGEIDPRRLLIGSFCWILIGLSFPAFLLVF